MKALPDVSFVGVCTMLKLCVLPLCVSCHVVTVEPGCASAGGLPFRLACGAMHLAVGIAAMHCVVCDMTVLQGAKCAAWHSRHVFAVCRHSCMTAVAVVSLHVALVVQQDYCYWSDSESLLHGRASSHLASWCAHCCCACWSASTCSGASCVVVVCCWCCRRLRLRWCGCTSTRPMSCCLVKHPWLCSRT